MAGLQLGQEMGMQIEATAARISVTGSHGSRTTEHAAPEYSNGRGIGSRR